MKSPERFIAAICLLLALPIAAMKLPTLPVTVLVFIDTLRELSVIGTESYAENRNFRLTRSTLALILYALGTFSLIGLVRVLLNRYRPLLGRLVWFCLLLTGIGLPLFARPTIGPETDRFYIACVIHLPLSLAVCAVAGLVCSFYFDRHRVDKDSLHFA